MKFKMIGKRFYRLKVIELVGKDSSNSPVFKCLCDCGNFVSKRGAHLRAGFIKSCGCYRIESSRIKGIAQKKHGMCRSGTYTSWTAMKFRCSNRGHLAYERYGGRGIAVCKSWMNFENFLKDMGERPLGKTLDRINGDGNYCPENCRWATYREQGRNRKNNRFLEYKGIRKTISEWATFLGFRSQNSINERLKRGWSLEESLQPKNLKGGL